MIIIEFKGNLANDGMDNDGMDNDGTIMTTMAWHQPTMAWRPDNDGMKILTTMAWNLDNVGMVTDNDGMLSDNDGMVKSFILFVLILWNLSRQLS